MGSLPPMSRLWRRSLDLAAAAAILLLTAGPATHAQNDSGSVWDPTINRGRPLNWFGNTRPAPPPRVVRRQRPVAAPRRTVAPSTVVVHDQPVLSKADPTTFVVVLGDSLADLVASGLDDAFGDRPDVALVHKSRTDSGLVRTDYHDWPKAVGELLASDQKITVAVMLVGANDNQSIREGETSHDPLSDRWRELYQARIDAIATAFAERKIPLVWIGTPPMQNGRLSAAMVAFNEMFRRRVERSGGVYVDLWDGFIDADNRYTASGPDISGQSARLRTGDGVHFTKAGARKAAHFADIAIRRLIQTAAPQNIIALPPALPSIQQPSFETQDAPSGEAPRVAATPPVASIDELIDRMAGVAPGLGSALQPPGPVYMPVKPLAGPILQLTGLAPAQGQALLGSADAARGSGQQAAELEHVFAEGQAPAPRPGRADDFRWPRHQKP